MKKYLAVLMFAGFAACNSGSSTKQTVDTSNNTGADTTAKATIQVSNVRCFSSSKGKNTVYLKIERFPNVVTGIIEYNFYKKDSSKGTIDGVLKGDTLISAYTFISEGKRSVKQVAFLNKDTTATEGYGDVRKRKDSILFKNTAALKFGSWVLREIPCPEQ